MTRILGLEVEELAKIEKLEVVRISSQKERAINRTATNYSDQDANWKVCATKASGIGIPAYRRRGSI